MRTLFWSRVNISAKFHQNWSLQIWAIPFQSWCVFLRHSVLDVLPPSHTSGKPVTTTFCLRLVMSWYVLWNSNSTAVQMGGSNFTSPDISTVQTAKLRIDIWGYRGASVVIRENDMVSRWFDFQVTNFNDRNQHSELFFRKSNALLMIQVIAYMTSNVTIRYDRRD